MSTPSDNRPRLREIDALRGIAASGVMIFHFLTRYHEVYGYPDPWSHGFFVGMYGVELFFVISGFVISLTLSRCRTGLDFLVSRFSRLYPTFWAAVLVTFTLVSALGLPGREVGFGVFLLNLTMLYPVFDVPPVDKVYWTLVIELQFYALMLAIFVLGWFRHLEKIALAWLLVQSALVLGALEFQLAAPGYLVKLMMLKYTHLFVGGIALYGIYSQGFSWLRSGMLLICTLNVQMMHGYTTYLSLELVLIVLFYGLLFLAIKGWLKPLAVRPLLWLGDISYALYLVHFHIGMAIIHRLLGLGLSPWFGITLATLVSLGLAWLITAKVEKPASSWIRQWHRVRRRTRPLST